MQFRFCPLCAAPLEGTYIRGRAYPRCPTGHYTYYPDQVVGVAAVIHDGGRVLLERRAVHPGYGLWALPGGMVEVGESLEGCLRREVLEETGLTVAVGRLLAARGGTHVTVIFYEATVVGGSLQKSAESLELRWFGPDEIPWAEMAFPRHREVLRAWVAGREG